MRGWLLFLAVLAYLIAAGVFCGAVFGAVVFLGDPPHPWGVVQWAQTGAAFATCVLFASVGAVAQAQAQAGTKQG